MKIVLIGGPGAGKGTQARILSKHYNITHVSTGDLLREQMELKTDLGAHITETMNEGSLVSDDLVTDLLRERLLRPDCKNGCIIDGYPRNLQQADILAETIAPDLNRTVYINVDDAIVIERMSGRESCAKCGQMYHTTYNPPKVKHTCDACGTALMQREDDKKSTVKNRLKIYHEMTKPIIEYYKKKNLLLEVNGVGDIHEITAFIINSLGK